MPNDKTLSQFTTVAFLTLAIFLPSLAYPDTKNMDCIKNKYEKYLQQKKQWNVNVSKLVIEEEPRFAEVAKELRLRETNLIEAQRIEFAFLVNENPGKLHLDRPLNQWVKLSKDEKKQLAAADNNYALLVEYSWDRATPKSRSDRKLMISKIFTNRKIHPYVRKNKQHMEEISKISCPKP